MKWEQDDTDALKYFATSLASSGDGDQARLFSRAASYIEMLQTTVAEYSQIVQYMKDLGWDQHEGSGQVRHPNDPLGQHIFEDWEKAIMACIDVASEKD